MVPARPPTTDVQKDVTKNESIVDENISTDHPLLKEDKSAKKSMINNYFIAAGGTD